MSFIFQYLEVICQYYVFIELYDNDVQNIIICYLNGTEYLGLQGCCQKASNLFEQVWSVSSENQERHMDATYAGAT